MLNRANQFNICCLLDNQTYSSTYHSVDCLLATGAVHSFSSNDEQVLDGLSAFCSNHQDWIFGHLNYELYNPTLIKTNPNKFDGIGFDAVFFFVPDEVIEIEGHNITISSITIEPQAVYEAITATSVDMPSHTSNVNIQPRLSKAAYITIIEQLRQHIQRGDCYEINFCQEFFDEHAILTPIATYHQLMAVSPNPFAAFYKVDDRYLLCASPERYLKKIGNRLISQPIKGTQKRAIDNALADEALRQQLFESEKNRSENVMVVDLVRNDLSRICTNGSVKVEELYGIYTFPQVHQMISTVSGELLANTAFGDILKATFPMGSMTGAPKKKVMELIDKYEPVKRGIFSGALGYIKPNGDFDFNVVIRSIMYNAATQYLSYQAGGGITFYSNPEEEYEESLLKAAAMKSAL